MSKSYNISTRGVVIARAAAADGSVRAYLFTHTNGLVVVFAKSAREERSKLRAHLQVGSYGTFTLVKGSREWRVVGAVNTRNSYFELSGRLDAQRASARVIGTVRHMIHGEQENVELAETLTDFLKALATIPDHCVRVAERLTVVRILYALGYVAENASLPYVHNNDYSADVLEDAARHEKALVDKINHAFAASNLIQSRAL